VPLGAVALPIRVVSQGYHTKVGSSPARIPVGLARPDQCIKLTQRDGTAVGHSLSFLARQKLVVPSKFHIWQTLASSKVVGFTPSAHHSNVDLLQ